MGQRPSAHEWIAPLESLARNLKRCSVNETHHYFQALTSCPWCRVEQAFGRAMFGIKITIIGGPDFDIVALWAEIDSVHADEQKLTTPSTNAYLDQCRPDSRIPQIKKQRRVRRLLSAGAILLAVMIVAPGWIPALPSICILIVGIAATVKLWQSAQECANPFTSEHKSAVRSFRRRYASLDRASISASGFPGH